MFFKEDWEQCKERLDTFWEGEMVDRCCISVLAPRNKRIELKVEHKEVSIYHWDGPGQIPHLGSLLDIKPLTAIQWTPGDGKPGACDECWFPFYRRIQEKG
jgi:hypothetical protein